MTSEDKINDAFVERLTNTVQRLQRESYPVSKSQLYGKLNWEVETLEDAIERAVDDGVVYDASAAESANPLLAHPDEPLSGDPAIVDAEAVAKHGKQAE
ncbi:hypothetical protein [Haloarcula nitratireducens]|uniref:Uncharacterized protein n=1 Tax=Haloarcula nitratireducens TaxID=2487749 RepID=A0AAW4PIL3_9EURY|nr:hypothetical protein [Halomicroarcula nitratireducens]MBX0297057.1 hypothetical protein [Halomicroarcula nitratireducens]